MSRMDGKKTHTRRELGRNGKNLCVTTGITIMMRSIGCERDEKKCKGQRSGSKMSEGNSRNRKIPKPNHHIDQSPHSTSSAGLEIISFSNPSSNQKLPWCVLPSKCFKTKTAHLLPLYCCCIVLLPGAVLPHKRIARSGRKLGIAQLTAHVSPLKTGQGVRGREAVGARTTNQGGIGLLLRNLGRHEGLDDETQHNRHDEVERDALRGSSAGVQDNRACGWGGGGGGGVHK